MKTTINLNYGNYFKKISTNLHKTNFASQANDVIESDPSDDNPNDDFDDDEDDSEEVDTRSLKKNKETDKNLSLRRKKVRT